MLAWILWTGACLDGTSGADLREALRDPARVFPAFQDLVEAGLYTKAYNVLLSPATHRRISPEEFQISFSAFEGLRRLVRSLGVHEVEKDRGAIRVCSPEFGASRRIGLVRWRADLWLLDLTEEDLEYFRDRILRWYRFQVRRADGWHFAYPPDWSFAPRARHCGCGR